MIAVELHGVDLLLRGEPLFEGLDFVMEQGEYIALLGPNGCGKTTLLRILLGLQSVDRGEVRVLDSSPAQARGRVGYVPQHARFDTSFPIRVLDVVLMGRLGVRGNATSSPRPPWHRRSPEDLASARAALERVELASFADRPIGALSGGEMQRVLIARALAMKPALLLLDEPTASLDAHVSRSHYELLDELSREMTILLVTHDIGAVSRYVRKVACLRRQVIVHETQDLTPEILQEAWGCPLQLVFHDHAGDHDHV